MLYDPYVVGDAGEVSAEQEIAATITRQLLPQLRKALADLNAMQQTWHVNGLPDKITAAAAADELLAGFPATTWGAWGEGLNLLQTFLSEEQPTLGGATVGQILLTRYQVQQ